MKASEVIGGILLGVLFFSFPIFAIWDIYRAPMRIFVIENGEHIKCRRMVGNRKYGIDLTDCVDGKNRYGIQAQVTVYSASGER